jgi:hypothetical protein
VSFLGSDTNLRVSIVIPTYQRAHQVAQALDSIHEPSIPLDQLQVIVVDNASTDGIAEVIAQHGARFPHLVFRQWETNVGPIENWRRGVRLAEAPWLKILWSDDRLEPRTIERMLGAAERNNARVVTCRAAVDYPDGRSVERYLDRPTTLTPDVIVSELLHFPAGLPSSPGAALIRTADAIAALESSLPAPCVQRAIGPDLAMTYWGVFAGGLGVHLPDVLARFAAGDDSITVRTPRAILSSCYSAAIGLMITTFSANIAPTTMRRLRSRAALDAMLGGEQEALLAPRRLSVRATVYDSLQIGRYAIRTHLLRRKTI